MFSQNKNCNRTGCFKYIEFIREEYFTKYTNITNLQQFTVNNKTGSIHKIYLKCDWVERPRGLFKEVVERK